ncbi:MAG: methyltransferase domain-containing protein [Acidobacteriota bacterium]
MWDARPDGRALDVGGACGRMTFELARDHRWAVGLDLAKALVGGAQQVKREGRARYKTIVEGRVMRDHDVEVETAPNASFLVASALDLPFGDGHFETVLALNLLDRVPDPSRALDELTRVTAPGGTLLLTTPLTWLEEFTAPDKWLGGFERNGRAVSGIEEAATRLSGAFAVEDERRLPFFIPHHARSGQLGLTCLLKLRRNA